MGTLCRIAMVGSSACRLRIQMESLHFVSHSIESVDKEALERISQCTTLEIFKKEVLTCFHIKSYSECLSFVLKAREIAPFDGELATTHIRCLTRMKYDSDAVRGGY